MSVYVLELEHGMYYVGYTARSVQERFEEHCAGMGAVWTEIHRPVRIIWSGPGNLEDERRITLETMGTYGWQNVRGGPWTQTHLDYPPRELSNVDDSQSSSPGEDDACFRCGRHGHWVANCYAATHVDGYYFGNGAGTSVRCYRCGRFGHYANRCFATTDAQGYDLSDDESYESDSSY